MADADFAAGFVAVRDAIQEALNGLIGTTTVGSDNARELEKIRAVLLTVLRSAPEPFRDMDIVVRGGFNLGVASLAIELVPTTYETPA